MKRGELYRVHKPGGDFLALAPENKKATILVALVQLR
jgi:hypothetical protein